MYNRYIRNDRGTYTRIPQEESAQTAPPPRQEPHQEASNATHTDFRPPECHGEERRWSDSLTGFLRHILDQLHLDHVDTGDLLLLILLFFLFREDADEELLVALGLLLIL